MGRNSAKKNIKSARNYEIPFLISTAIFCSGALFFASKSSVEESPNTSKNENNSQRVIKVEDQKKKETTPVEQKKAPPSTPQKTKQQLLLDRINSLNIERYSYDGKNHMGLHYSNNVCWFATLSAVMANNDIVFNDLKKDIGVTSEAKFIDEMAKINLDDIMQYVENDQIIDVDSKKAEDKELLLKIKKVYLYCLMSIRGIPVEFDINHMKKIFFICIHVQAKKQYIKFGDMGDSHPSYFTYQNSQVLHFPRPGHTVSMYTNQKFKGEEDLKEYLRDASIFNCRNAHWNIKRLKKDNKFYQLDSSRNNQYELLNSSPQLNLDYKEIVKYIILGHLQSVASWLESDIEEGRATTREVGEIFVAIDEPQEDFILDYHSKEYKRAREHILGDNKLLGESFMEGKTILDLILLYKKDAKKLKEIGEKIQEEKKKIEDPIFNNKEISNGVGTKGTILYL